SIADGILPGNEGRNYVLRKIMRRAIYHGRHALGFDDLFLYKVTNFVCDMMSEAYPELDASREFIERMVKLEESRFATTLTIGLQKLDALFAQTQPGEYPAWKELAKLYDTFGTPRDLIRVALEERGLTTFDEETFNSRFDLALRELQQAGARGVETATKKTKEVYQFIAERVGRTEFTGYESTRLAGAKVVALIKGDEEVDALRAGEEGEVVLDRTPFYAEAGGQVGDVGTLVRAIAQRDWAETSKPEEAHVTVNDTVAPVGGTYVHRVTVERGARKSRP